MVNSMTLAQKLLRLNFQKCSVTSQVLPHVLPGQKAYLTCVYQYKNICFMIHNLLINHFMIDKLKCHFHCFSEIT